MQIKWLNKALQNLNDEAEYIAQTNPQAARQFLQHVIDSINQLSDNPALGHLGRIHGTRELVLTQTRHIIPYRVNTRLKQIEILRVFHTSRRLPQRW